MGSVKEVNRSLWVATTDGAEINVGPGLFDGRGSTFDVVVVGAGVAGLTTARLLVDTGARVAVLDAGPVAAGVTGYTTAKVTALQRTTAGELVERHGAERTTAYVQANAASVEKVAELVAADAIDCQMERAPACTYTSDAARIGDIEAELGALRAAGLPARMDSATELPFAVASAVWLDEQLQFHPRKYCLGLAGAVMARGGVVAEHTTVVDVTEDGSGCTVAIAGTDQVVRAQHVVLATHLPFPLAGEYFARAHPYRSYAMAARIAGKRPRGMYISAESPTRSVRSAADGWMIIGGEGHKVGQDPDTRERYAAIEAFGREHWTIEEIGYRWSAQDFETIDGLPYVGKLTSAHERVWVATGFRKWGFSNGTAAAIILTDLIQGRDNPWAETFRSTRLPPRTGLKTLVSENLDVGKHFVGDRLAAMRPPASDTLAPGEGGLVELEGETVAGYRDEDGTLHAVSATCTHLGCKVQFNTAERSWDCPCHGSRFDADGNVLQGPALERLKPIKPSATPS